MKYDNLVSKLLEDFNVSPAGQNVINSGPDQGVTIGDPNNTFPSKNSQVEVRMPEKRKKRLKRLTRVNSKLPQAENDSAVEIRSSL